MTAPVPSPMQIRENGILNFIRPYLKDPPPERDGGYWTPPPGLIPDLTGILTFGYEWLTQEARKKEIAQYRKLLQKARDYRDGSRDLRYRFPSFKDFPCVTGAPILHEADTLLAMIEECDKILGTKEPKRHPRRVIIWESLALWVRFTGKTPPRNAFQPNPHSGDRLAPPYAFARLILSSIEDCTDTGDFSGMYEAIVKKHFLTK